jgi:arylsulfatase A-like enzyme
MKLTRRDFVASSAAGLAAAALPRASRASGPPNIVYLLLDDAGWGDLSCYGQRRFATPNIDRLAASGLRFTDHYSGAPICAPSRCCLMTGLHTGHAAIRDNGFHFPEGEPPLAADAVTLPRLLRGRGYAAGMFGKWGLGYPGSVSDPTEHFDEFFGYNGQVNAHNYYPNRLWHNRERVPLDGRTYAHDLIVDAAKKFIRESAGRPFFCYLPVTIPHAALQVPEEDVRPFRRRFWYFEATPGFYDAAPIRNPAACFAGMMTRIDRQVGELLSLLDELGVADNTLVMLSSDNGPHAEGGAMPQFFHSAGPFRGIKRDLYEGGIRVPFIARWPGRIPAGQVSDLPSAAWDLIPTFCELAGIDAPADIDGISFLPTLLGREADQRRHDYLYWEWPNMGGRQAVRMGNWKGVRYGVKRRPDAPVQLYDLATDPGEKNNLAPHNHEMVARMVKVMWEAHVDSKAFPLF